MIDREKVLKGLRCCADLDAASICPDDCPYYDSDKGITCAGRFNLHRDLLEMLEPVAPEIKRFGDICIFRCGHCGNRLMVDSIYCQYCGRRVKRE